MEKNFNCKNNMSKLKNCSGFQAITFIAKRINLFATSTKSTSLVENEKLQLWNLHQFCDVHIFVKQKKEYANFTSH